MIQIGLDQGALQDMLVDVVAYGAKDTGEMGGGAAAAILSVAGPELVAALRAALPGTTRQVGDAVLTESFGLRQRGVRWIAHVISIIKNTPEGAWCPQPEKIYDGVVKALELSARKGARSIAFSMLGTGEGRVKPPDAARSMVRAVRDFHRGGGRIEVTFALPTFRDFEAARRMLACE